MEDYSKYSDSDLGVLFCNGNDAAFKEIYIRYDKLLFLFATRKLGDEDEAMDVVQDVFTWVLNNRQHLAVKTSLSSYLYKSVLNKIFDIFRHQQTIRKYIAQGDYTIDVDSHETDYLIREKDVRDMINKEIEAMPTRMREVYKLKHLKNLNAKEIAEQLGISEHTVNVHLQRGLKQLKNNLGVLIYVIYVLNS